MKARSSARKFLNSPGEPAKMEAEPEPCSLLLSPSFCYWDCNTVVRVAISTATLVRVAFTVWLD